MGETAHEAVAGPGPNTLTAAAARARHTSPSDQNSPSSLTSARMTTTSRSSREPSRTPEAQQHHKLRSTGMPALAGPSTGPSHSDKRYCLEVAQAPTRGRTCGFGDADRRALSAPLIARLRLYDSQTGSELPVDNLDISFLVAAADLWSADGTEEMNLVQHPASHYIKAPSPVPGDLYRLQSSYDSRPTYSSHSLAGHVRPVSRGTVPDYPEDPYQPHLPYSSNPQYHPHHPHRPYSPPSPPPPSTERLALSSQQPLPHPAGTRSSPSTSQHYPLPGAVKQEPGRYEPDIHETRVKVEGSSGGSPQMSTFAFQAPRPSPPYHNHDLPPEGFEAESLQSSSTSYLDHPSTAASTVSSLGLRPTTMSRARPSTGATSLSAAAHVSGESFISSRLEGEVACVKNLIGALTTNGHKLRAPGESRLGVFFVFHDLSVRTEGTFRIRLRLVSIGDLFSGMHSGTSPVLSECFTTPFEVMSAKKFPGMLDPTPMSQAFAKQGLRIPTRKGANRKRRRPEGHGDRERNGSPSLDEEEEDLLY